MNGAPVSPARAADVSRRAARLLIAYTLMRLALFAVLTAMFTAIGAGILAAAGHDVDYAALRPILLAAAFVAVPAALLISQLLLRGWRERLGEALAAAVSARRAHSAARVAREDEADEIARATQAAESQAARDAEAGESRS